MYRVFTQSLFSLFAFNIILYEQGETMTGISKDMDLTSYRIPIGVCAGIAPFNFPAMIPLWMFPM